MALFLAPNGTCGRPKWSDISRLNTRNRYGRKRDGLPSDTVRKIEYQILQMRERPLSLCRQKHQTPSPVFSVTCCNERHLTAAEGLRD